MDKAELEIDNEDVHDRKKWRRNVMKPTQHIEITHPNNVNLKLAFHKASFHPHYLTFTPQTYHHPVHRFRSWPTQMTLPSHPQARVQPKKYIQPYLHTVFAWTKQSNLILNPDKTTCPLFTPDPAEYTINLDLKIHNNAIPMASHPKVLGLTLDPKTHIQHTHPQHLSTMHTNLYKS